MGSRMRPLSEMPIDDHQRAADAADTVIKYREYLPMDGLLVYLLGSFRDDIRAVQGVEAGPRPMRGRDLKSLDELTSTEFAVLSEAVDILLNRVGAFIPRTMTGANEPDAALVAKLGELWRGLEEQGAERDEILQTFVRAS